MYARILTEHERKMIKTYVETGEKPPGFRTLLHRARHMDIISDDMTQIKWLLAKADAEKTKETRTT